MLKNYLIAACYFALGLGLGATAAKADGFDRYMQGVCSTAKYIVDSTVEMRREGASKMLAEAYLDQWLGGEADAVDLDIGTVASAVELIVDGSMPSSATAIIYDECMKY